MKVTDPVCGMAILPERAAATFTHDGKEYYFCTEACKTQFVESPDSYIIDRQGS